MCFNNSQPTPPQIAKVAPPPPPKQLQIAQQSTLPERQVTKPEKKEVAFGAKSTRDKAKAPKRDAASLLIPMGNKGNKPGGLNI
jgi:hypothetical protein|tara:strand:- start:978 stop:1229 length:252 start_codon:yes stop_codon:yes gene_type:complete